MELFGSPGGAFDVLPKVGLFGNPGDAFDVLPKVGLFGKPGGLLAGRLFIGGAGLSGGVLSRFEEKPALLMAGGALSREEVLRSVAPSGGTAVEVKRPVPEGDPPRPVFVEPDGVLPNDPAAGKFPAVGMVLPGGGKVFADKAPAEVLVGVGVRTRPDDGAAVPPNFCGVVLLVFWHPVRAMKTTLPIHNNCFMERLFSLNLPRGQPARGMPVPWPMDLGPRPPPPLSFFHPI